MDLSPPARLIRRSGPRCSMKCEYTAAIPQIWRVVTIPPKIPIVTADSIRRMAHGVVPGRSRIGEDGPCAGRSSRLGGWLEIGSNRRFAEFLERNLS